jgi:type I restriction enzyme S subunit
MSKFEDLVELFCPNGVPVKRLGDVLEVFNGYAFKAESFNSIQLGVPIIRIRDVNSGFSSTYFEGEYDEKYLVQNEDLLIGMDGDFQITRWKHGQALLNQRVCRLQNFQGILPSFVFHFIPAELTAIQNATNSGTVNHISSKQIGDILIPVPPIEVQHEIVLILDRFIHLEAELEAELEARKTQYSEFLKTTFNFDGYSEVVWSDIADVCSTFSGAFVKKTKQDDNFEYPVFNGGATATGRYSDFNSPANSIAISARGSIGAVNWVPTKFWAGNSCHVVLATDPRLNNRFLYHYLKFHEPSLYALRAVGSIPALNLKPLLKFKVPIPAMEVQTLISQALDKFEALINDTSAGLPAEISARRAQYEYYRSKLLTFKELDVA